MDVAEETKHLVDPIELDKLKEFSNLLVYILSEM